MLKLMEDLEFKRTSDDFQKILKADMERIRRSDAVFERPDKTRKLYEMDRKQCEQLLRENVTKNCKQAPAETYETVNVAAKVNPQSRRLN